MLASSAFLACTDDLAVGNASLDKASSSTATVDSVFANAEYTRQFVAGIYSMQYYGLPYNNYYNTQQEHGVHHSAPYVGKFDALTDCWHMFWNGAAVYNRYYNGSLTANVGRPDKYDGPLYSFDGEQQWKTIREGHILISRIGDVPEMTAAEKARLVAETRCLMVSAYWETFQHYGGIPILDHALEIDEVATEFARRPVGDCIDWMVAQLDTAIMEPNFPWVTSDPVTMTGRWTRAGARALKAKILQFAASPMLNPQDGKPYYDGVSEELKPFLMYTDGSQYQQRWDRFYQACKDFFDDLSANGYYQLTTADASLKGSTEKNVPAFRLAYRKGYFLQDSKEILHTVRVMGADNTATARYCWHSWYSNSVPRNLYEPTEEYVEKFSYFDGEPFNWESAYDKVYNADGSLKVNAKTGNPDWTSKGLNTMFVRGTFPTGERMLNATLTRDPRLYEECVINGVAKHLDWTTASMSGDTFEMWVGGTDSEQAVPNQSNHLYCSGYGMNKYLLGDGTSGSGCTADNMRYFTQWVSLSLSEMYLMYAEALMKKSSPDYTAAAEQIDVVRARVGLPTIAKVWTSKKHPSYTATTLAAAATTTVALPNGDQSTELYEELLDERVRELGLTNAHWFDMIRNKRTDWMTTQLHGLEMHRIRQNVEGKWVEYDKAWANGDKLTDAGSTQPRYFTYKRFEITGNSRVLWGKDPKSNDVRKWLLSPFPQNEINKNYGIIQNPGWE